jgi:hypothetical protein
MQLQRGISTKLCKYTASYQKPIGRHSGMIKTRRHTRVISQKRCTTALHIKKLCNTPAISKNDAALHRVLSKTMQLQRVL